MAVAALNKGNYPYWYNLTASETRAAKQHDSFSGFVALGNQQKVDQYDRIKSLTARIDTSEDLGQTCMCAGCKLKYGHQKNIFMDY